MRRFEAAYARAAESVLAAHGLPAVTIDKGVTGGITVVVAAGSAAAVRALKSAEEATGDDAIDPGEYIAITRHLAIMGISQQVLLHDHEVLLVLQAGPYCTLPANCAFIITISRSQPSDISSVCVRSRIGPLASISHRNERGSSYSAGPLCLGGRPPRHSHAKGRHHPHR